LFITGNFPPSKGCKHNQNHLLQANDKEFQEKKRRYCPKFNMSEDNENSTDKNYMKNELMNLKSLYGIK